LKILEVIALLLLSSTPAVLQTEEVKPKVFSKKEVDSLSKEVGKFIKCWYIKQDSECFWSYWAEAALTLPLKIFKDAFNDSQKENKKIEIHLGYIEQELLEKSVKCLNATKDDHFCILSGFETIDVLKYLYGEEIIIPEHKPDLFFFSIYVVEGWGYNKNGIVIVWIKEKSLWKVFSVMEFE